MAKHNQHVGSDFDDFLADENLLEGVTAVALKRVIAWQLEEARKARGLGKKAMAELMHTSRSQLNRILDESDTSLTLESLSKAAQAVGYRVRIELEAA
ncbi:helix-turn-helix domain-containing protein [uncultured Abyssibacter sp.]|uniref:helix-turn-helix domain-containing protein n=1 Tax=uncultured Abyssibacter sp. TaxID=2320202 RepID=UPI0032B2948C|tara:strand:- start:541 stop:834 length:294 start_codon:yes stop_codon:yes gene_type:complete